MWSKISNVLKPRVAHEDPEPSSSQADVMSRVFEQHPNLSVFHSSAEHGANHSPPPSPTKSTKRNMFKRLSKAPFKDDNDSLRAPSPMIGQPKKVRSPFNLGNGNNSQASLSKAPTEHHRPSPTRRSSFDMLRPATESGSRSAATISSGTTLRRPSLDMLRMNQDTPPVNEPSPMTPSADVKFGSVRSILRDPKTPGTGQNVRFFSRDAYKVISPDQSMDVDFQSMAQVDEQPVQKTTQEAGVDRRIRTTPDGPGTPAITRASSGAKATRPTVAEVFSPLSSVDGPPPPAKEQVNFLNSTNLLSPIPAPDFTDLFDMSQNLDLPKVPPGLGFNVKEPVLDNSVEMSMTDVGHAERSAQSAPISAMTSTPFRDKGKGKAKEVTSDLSADKENLPMPIDETIFHAREKSPRLPAVLHDRSQSFSFGQTVFHSMANASSSVSNSPDTSAVFSSADLKASLLDKNDSPARASSPKLAKNRSRALSDTVFQSMMRASPKPPEEDINDESSPDLVVYSPEQPDPFRANATTYYTPQTMIPVTPPQGAPRHVRKTSKEDSIIFSLQTQLALQTELCGQYETDLRARDELVEILGKKLSDVEKEEGKRRSLLRSWKKKVQELEKTCRYLEEEVEGSRQDSMERSIMDEASGEALRMLHRQISALEREKAEWLRKEEILREEVETLEGLVKERSEDVQQLKETLWNRDESQRELQEGIREAKEQMEQMGNVSCGLIDEDELKRLVLEKEQRSEQERERHRVAEFGWEEERAEFVTKVRRLEAHNSTLEADLETTKLRLQTREEEYGVLKTELNAQWEHTEKATEKIEALKSQVLDLEKERDALKGDIEGLEQRMTNVDDQWEQNEKKNVELENELQEVWNYKEDLEQERDQLENQLREERDQSERLTTALRECEDRISQLDQERQFAQENVSRLEEKLRQREQDTKESSQRMMEREAEAEQLREEMSNLRREHAHAISEQNRTLEEVSMREGEARTQLEALVRQQATVDIEMKASADKINALKEEVERLRRKIQSLQQESADKEVKLVQLAKQHQRDKEDLEGINTALDSKQMELELIKRNLGVRGTGGATPAPASRVAHARRDSVIFNTPISRPPSSASDAGSTIGKDRKRTVTETPASSATKTTTLGKSIRGNLAGNVNSSTASASKRVEGSMGPPPSKARPSAAAVSTPTPAPRVTSLQRSSSAKPTPQPAVSVPRRVSSLEQTLTAAKSKPPRQPVNQRSVPRVSEQEEKENVDVSSQRKSMIPTPA